MSILFPPAAQNPATGDTIDSTSLLDYSKNTQVIIGAGTLESAIAETQPNIDATVSFYDTASLNETEGATPLLTLQPTPGATAATASASPQVAFTQGLAITTTSLYTRASVNVLLSSRAQIVDRG